MCATQAGSPGRERFDDYRTHDRVFDAWTASPRTLAAGYSVQVATDLEAIEALRPVWSQWTGALDADFDYFLHQLRQDPAGLEPCVIAVYAGGLARAMLVGQIRKQKSSTVVAFVNVPGPTVRVLEIRKDARLGETTPQVDEILARELLHIMKSGRVDLLCLKRLSLQSGLFLEIQKLPGFLLRKRVPHVFQYSVMPLNAPGRNFNRIFPGKVIRENRRKTRIVERAFPGQLRLHCFSQPGELDFGLREAMRVAAATWQDYMGPGLTDTAAIRETYRFFAERGWLRIYVLYLGAVPCAFLAGQLYNQNFYCQFAGYHPDYARFSVGSLLSSRVFEELAAAGVQCVDLGEGGQEHNRRLGCQKTEEGTVHIYSPTWRGACLNLFFGTAQAIRAGGRGARSALHLSWAGRAWAKFLLSRWSSRKPSPESLAEIPRNI